MSVQNCPEPELLSGFCHGMIEDTDAAWVASHVEGCDDCQRNLDSLIDQSQDQLKEALRRSLGPADPFAAESMCRDVVERIAQLSTCGSYDDYEQPELDETPDVPEFIGGYKILQLLGQGGMGAVYQAVHLGLDKIVALKVLAGRWSGNKAAIARFQREMKAVGKLQHPNIVAAFDAGEVGGTHYLVMEYVAGIDVSHLIRQRVALPVAEACEIIRQSAVGLEHAAGKGLVHRDIKPSNLILTSDATGAILIKVLDLGLALLDDTFSASLSSSQQTNLSWSGQVMGTIDYMAPEQALDSHDVDGRADVYSLGATLCKLLTGEPPYIFGHETSVARRLAALAYEDVPSIASRRPDLPPDLVLLVDAMLARDRNQRPGSPGEVAQRLVPFAKGANLGLLLTSGNQATSETGDLSQLTCLSLSQAPLQPGGDNSQSAADSGRRGRRAGRSPVTRLAMIGLAACGALAAFLAVQSFIFRTPHGFVSVEVKDPRIKVSLAEHSFTLQNSGEKFEFTPGEHSLRIQNGKQTFETDKFSVLDGQSELFKVQLVSNSLKVLHGDRELPFRGLDSQAGQPAAASPPGAATSGTPKPIVAPFDADAARKSQLEWARHLDVPLEFQNSIGMKFTLIPAGEFQMGCTPDEYQNQITEQNAIDPVDNWWRERLTSQTPRHRVILTRPFYLGMHEVTQQDYQKVTNVNPSFFKALASQPGGDAFLSVLPVENVSWLDSAVFCAKLSTREKLAPNYSIANGVVEIRNSHGYRLPTEAEWEFACRAGSTTRYWFGDSDGELSTVAWYSGNSYDRPHPVGTLRANPFGLFDMHGNVWEYVQDWWSQTYYDDFTQKPAVDPQGPPSGLNRVQRGGAFSYRASAAGSSFRDAPVPAARYAFMGFRVALSVEAVQQVLHGKSAPVPAPSESEDDHLRRIARWVLQEGAILQIVPEDLQTFSHILREQDLPSGRFAITKIDFQQPLKMTEERCEDFGKLKNLAALAINDIELTEPFITQLATLPYLNELEFRAYQKPLQNIHLLQRLPALRKLRLYDPQLNEDGIKTIGQMKQLTYLEFRHVPLTDELLVHLRDLHLLDDLICINSKLTGRTLDQLSGLKDLTHLSMAYAPVVDEALPHIQQFKKLVWLNIGGSRVTDQGLKSLTLVPWLKRLTLEQTQIGDAGLVYLPPITALHMLDLRHTRISDAGVETLSTLTGLSHLQVGKGLSSQALANLQSRLPACQVTED